MNALSTLALVMAFGLPSGAAAATSAIHVVDPIARIQPGPKGGTAFLLIRIDARTPSQLAENTLPELKDLELPPPLAAKVQAGRVTVFSMEPDARTWGLDLAADGLEPEWNLNTNCCLSFQIRPASG